VIVVVVVLGLAGSLALGLALAAGDPATTAGPLRLGVGRFTLATLLERVVLVARHDDGDVARALADAGTATAGTGTPALHRGAFVGERPRDEQLFFRHAVVVLGVRDRGVEQLHHGLGGTALTEAQDLAGVGDVLADDESEHLADLGRRGAVVAQARGGFDHQRRLDLSCPAWYRNVRVGANSPSLWPTIASVT
jgi:hypothetical protein